MNRRNHTRIVAIQGKQEVLITRDVMMCDDMTKGINESYERLDELLGDGIKRPAKR